MGKGGRQPACDESTGSVREITWEEVREHKTGQDKWIVIDGQVYDISTWARRHPGGPRIIGHYAGQDATEAFVAFHTDMHKVKKYMGAIHIGEVVATTKKTEDDEMKHDFIALREKATKMGLFRPSVFFYVMSVAHLIFFEALAYLILYHFGTGWMPWIASVICYTIVQAQAGWSQHDFGHLSVFKNNRFNHLLHLLVMNLIKGASASWWQHLHNQHHAKPNVVGKDPDVHLERLFLFGETLPKRIAKSKKRTMPYNWQHRYFFAIGPPLLFPVYFQYMIFKHPISRGHWFDVFMMSLFYVKIMVLYGPLLGVFGAIKYYFMIRCLESHWFVWVSQSNHIPMEIDDDKERPWLSLQLHATCDVEKSLFNDWFTGHLNFQIEHHLFPTMPRHNLHKISADARALCKKHNLPYQVKTLFGAFSDIVKSLKHSGEIWLAYKEAYNL